MRRIAILYCVLSSLTHGTSLIAIDSLCWRTLCRHDVPTLRDMWWQTWPSIFVLITYHHTGVSYAVQVVTSDFDRSYPFYSWPGNETVGDGNSLTELTLLCVVHSCDHGPFLMVGFQQYNPTENCIKRRNQSREEGIWFLKIKLTLQQIHTILNSSATLDPIIPVWCKTSGGRTSEMSYIHVRSEQSPSSMVTANPTPENNCLPDSVVYVSSNSTGNSVTKLFKITTLCLALLFIIDRYLMSSYLTHSVVHVSWMFICAICVVDECVDHFWSTYWVNLLLFCIHNIMSMSKVSYMNF